MLTYNDIDVVLSPYKTNAAYLSQDQANRLELDLIILFSNQVCDHDSAKILSRFLTISIFDDLMDERTIKHRCGYLCCSNPTERQSRNVLRVLSANTHAANNTPHNSNSLTPYSYLNNYCCKSHYQCSVFYRAQLRETALFARKYLFLTPSGSLLNKSNYSELVRSPFYEYEKGDNGKMILLEEVWEHQRMSNQASLIDVMAQMSVGERQTGSGKPEIPDELMTEVVEKFPKLELEETDDMSNAEKMAKGVEGYVTEW